MKRWVLLLLGCFLLLTGCRKETVLQPMGSVIQKMTVIENQNGYFSMTEYKDDTAFSSVMEQFRHHKIRHQSSIPDSIGQELYSVIVTCADGSTHYYERLDNAYVRKDSGAWHKIIQNEQQ